MRILAYKNILKLFGRAVKYISGLHTQNCLKNGQVLCFKDGICF
ncbi:hypothetical protein DET1004 [Dehalococcoides mccartyi 195]|uniref:Uncharacterized protein n=1 Tax=Dehalococcoides mccartyi (strain ATCC BAA-2266 / KCTC 15142 / 195) TaxID=243164 RepID=Q3Z7S5_DEHM1|nr:hypothetical protein DET1004 [Dehalococcoides mccartyi 195]